jgi:hypothetical protein
LWAARAKPKIRKIFERFFVLRKRPNPTQQNPGGNKHLPLLNSLPFCPSLSTICSLPRCSLPRYSLPRCFLPRCSLPRCSLPHCFLPVCSLSSAFCRLTSSLFLCILPAPFCPLPSGLSTHAALFFLLQYAEHPLSFHTSVSLPLCRLPLCPLPLCSLCLRLLCPMPLCSLPGSNFGSRNSVLNV